MECLRGDSLNVIISNPFVLVFSPTEVKFIIQDPLGLVPIEENLDLAIRALCCN